jgi:hypothetical protein
VPSMPGVIHTPHRTSSPGSRGAGTSRSLLSAATDGLTGRWLAEDDEEDEGPANAHRAERGRQEQSWRASGAGGEEGVALREEVVLLRAENERLGAELAHTRAETARLVPTIAEEIDRLQVCACLRHPPTQAHSFTGEVMHGKRAGR